MLKTVRFASFAVLIVCALGLKADSPLPLSQRVAELEDYRQQQRDWNHEFDQRTQQAQGAQDARIQTLENQIASLESSRSILWAFGTVGAFILSVGAPIAWGAYSRRQLQTEREHRELERAFKALGHPDDEPPSPER